MSILLKKRNPIEIDFDAQKIPLLRKMFYSASFSLRWDYGGLSGLSGFYGTQKDWNQTITNKINEISANIHRATLKGGADTLIVSCEVLSILEDNDYITNFKDGTILLGNRYEVHVNKYLPPYAMIVCKLVPNEEDWFKNPKLMGVIMVDGLGTEAKLWGEIDKEILNGLRMGLTNRRYLLIK